MRRLMVIAFGLIVGLGLTVTPTWANSWGRHEREVVSVFPQPRDQWKSWGVDHGKATSTVAAAGPSSSAPRCQHPYGRRPSGGGTAGAGSGCRGTGLTELNSTYRGPLPRPSVMPS